MKFFLHTDVQNKRCTKGTLVSGGRVLKYANCLIFNHLRFTPPRRCIFEKITQHADFQRVTQFHAFRWLFDRFSERCTFILKTIFITETMIGKKMKLEKIKRNITTKGDNSCKIHYNRGFDNRLNNANFAFSCSLVKINGNGISKNSN